MISHVEFLMGKCENSSYTKANIHKNAQAHIHSKNAVTESRSAYTHTHSQNSQYHFISFLVLLLWQRSFGRVYGILWWLSFAVRKDITNGYDEWASINCAADFVIGNVEQIASTTALRWKWKKYTSKAIEQERSSSKNEQNQTDSTSSFDWWLLVRSFVHVANIYLPNMKDLCEHLRVHFLMDGLTGRTTPHHTRLHTMIFQSLQSVSSNHNSSAKCGVFSSN